MAFFEVVLPLGFLLKRFWKVGDGNYLNRIVLKEVFCKKIKYFINTNANVHTI